MAGVKYDSEKPPMALLPPTAITAVAEVIGFGARKYGVYNWRGGMRWTRLASAALRHIFAWLAGEDTDAESGLTHLAHAATDLLMLIEYVATGGGEDDRYRPGGEAKK